MTFVKNLDLYKILKIILFVLLLYYIYHISNFIWSTGLCLNGNTGRIAGNQSLNAGALPLETPHTLSIDLTRPVSSITALVGDLIVIVSLIIAALKYIFDKYAHIMKGKFSYVFIVSALIILVSCIECNFSCELMLNHANIQRLYADISKNRLDIILDKKVFAGNAEIYELRGEMGEPSCRAFVVKIGSRGSKIIENWVSKPNAKKFDSQIDNSLYSIVSSQYDNRNISRLHISASIFTKFKDINKTYDLYSVIGCLTWPYSVVDELP